MAIAIILQGRQKENKKLYPWKIIVGEEEKLNGACLEIIAKRKKELNGIYYPSEIREDRIPVEEEYHTIIISDSDIINI